MPVAAPTHKPVRSDAKRNREQIISVARSLFATLGVEASVDEITRAAGVGMGTLYRHFPTKEALVDAVLEDTFDEYLGLARSALETHDAWLGLTTYLEQALAMHAANRGLKDVVEARAHGRERAAAVRRELRALLVQLIERAHDQGTLRADFSVDDLPVLLWGGDGVIECSAAAAPEIWRRYLGFVLDGLRADAATPLPHAPLSRAQLTRAGRKPL